MLPFLQWCVCIFLPLFQFQKSPLSSKKNPPAAGVESSIYRLEGSGQLLRVGEQGSAKVGWAVGAAGKTRLPWFLVIQGRGASGLGRARGAPELMKNEECLPSPAARPGEGERRTVSFKTTLFCYAQNSGPLFFFYIYIKSSSYQHNKLYFLKFCGHSIRVLIYRRILSIFVSNYIFLNFNI